MRAELKRLHSPDAPAGDISEFEPQDLADLGLAVEAMVGPAGAPGEEQFQFTVCSPKWLARQPLQNGFAFQRNTLLLERWDARLVERAIGDLCWRSEGNSWEEVATKLSRYGRWEFEGYWE